MTITLWMKPPSPLPHLNKCNRARLKDSCNATKTTPLGSTIPDDFHTGLAVLNNWCWEYKRETFIFIFLYDRGAGMVCTYRHHLGSSKPGSIGKLTDGSPTSSPRPTFGSSGLWLLWLLRCDNRLGLSPLCQPRHYNDVQCYTTERYKVK